MTTQAKGGYKWHKLVRVTEFKPTPRAIIERTMAQYNNSEAEARAMLESQDGREEVYVNDLYQIAVHRHKAADREAPDLVHINIRRRDGAPITRDWRHFQQIKNEILGPECEAVELYPAESRKVDEANKYHLWGLADPKFRFPIGWDERNVDYTESRDTPGMRQRPQSMRISDADDDHQSRPDSGRRDGWHGGSPKA